MRKNSQYISISEYCKVNGLHTTKLYETLSGHPELAKKLKTNAKGERVLDEKAITAAGEILRKENRAKRGRSSTSSAADEINILAAKNEVLRKEVSRMKVLLWETRTSKGFTLMELSKKSGIGKSTINNIENGKVSPTLFQLEMIAIALGVKITDLFESEYK